jgi:hypothetical protein
LRQSVNVFLVKKRINGMLGMGSSVISSYESASYK